MKFIAPALVVAFSAALFAQPASACLIFDKNYKPKPNAESNSETKPETKSDTQSEITTDGKIRLACVFKPKGPAVAPQDKQKQQEKSKA